MERHTMTSQEMLQSDLLEILFENRNKQYGAYELRRFYPARLSKAFLISVGMIAVLLWLFQPQYKEMSGYVPDEEDSGIVVRTQTIPDIPPPPPPKNADPPSAPVQQIKYSGFHISENADITDVPDQDALVDPAFGITTVAGFTPDIPPQPVPVITETPAVVTKPVSPGYIAPEFPGGITAWIHFLNRNLRVPESLEAGEKKSVMVKFFVSIEGTVSGFQVIQSAGREYDEEVIRVLKNMLKWKPGLQNGEPVAISFTQPVTFIGLEE